MQKLIFLFSILGVLSCVQEKSETDNIRASDVQESRIWQQTDTLSNLGNGSFDSVRQIKLEPHNLSGLHLEAKADAAFYLFFGDKLIKKSNGGSLNYSFDSTAHATTYLGLSEDVHELTYGIYSLEKSKDNESYAEMEKIERGKKWISDNLLIIILIGASVFMVIIKVNYDKRYVDILSFNKIFTTRLNEGDQSRVRVMDQDNLVFAGFYTFLTAGLIYFLSKGKNIEILGIEANGIIEYLKILTIVAIGLIAKVILVSLASNLFGNGKIPAFYVKEMLNINLFFVIILFFGSIFIYLFAGAIPSFWLSVATYALLSFYLARLILLYFKILKLSSFTNLYLFSYFCTTEIFPFLIGLKYFMR